MSKTLSLLAALCLLWAVPSLARGSFVYVTNYGDGTVSQFRAHPNGTLTPLSLPCVPLAETPYLTATDPHRPFLYMLSLFGRHSPQLAAAEISFF